MLQFHEEVKVVPSIKPQSLAAGTTNGDLGGTSGWIDTKDVDAAAAVFQFGAVDDTLTDVDISVYENDAVTGNGTLIEGAASTDLAGANIDAQAHIIDMALGGRANHKRYIRPRIVAGATGNMLVSVNVHLYKARTLPVTQTVAAVVA